MNWDDIRFVLTVARLGSLNAASAKLGVTHATVMRRVASFEANHNQQIFRKSQSGYKVLPEALPVIRSMESIEEATMAMERTLTGADQSPSGSVRVASTDSLCNLVLPPVISKVCETYPRIDISLLSANVHHDLSRLSADIVVRATNKLDDTLTGQCVGRIIFSAYSTDVDQKMWLRPEGVLSASIAAQWTKDNVSESQIAGGADSFLALQRLAAEGLGKVILPEFIGDAEPRLTKDPHVRAVGTASVWVAMLNEFAHVPRFVRVQSVLVKALSTSPLLSPIAAVSPV